MATPFLLLCGFSAHILLGAGHPVAFNSVRLCAALTYSLGIVALWLCKLGSVWTFVLVFVGAQIFAAALAAWLVWKHLRPRLWIPEPQVVPLSAALWLALLRFVSRRRR